MAMTLVTVEELADELRLPADDVLRMLREDQARGIVECVDGRWRLTEAAEAKFGAALRKFEIPRTELTRKEPGRTLTHPGSLTRCLRARP